MKRRRFIQISLAGTALLTAFPYELFAGTKKLFPSDRVQLGNTGIEMSRMAMGTGTRGFGGSSNQTRKLGIKGVSDLLRAAYDEGINFWETADQYGSHSHLKEAMKKIEREKLVLLTKTNSTSYKDVKSDLERFKTELGTDYFDIVLLHAVTDPDWNKNMKGAMEALSEAKELGTIRAHGVQKVLTRMKKNGKAIIGMKVYGQGKLADKKDECLEFHTGAGFFDHFTLGIESYEQLKDIQKRLPEASVRG
jgi:hypothetical protein